MNFLEQVKDIVRALGQTLKHAVQRVADIVVIVLLVVDGGGKLGEARVKLLGILHLGNYQNYALRIKRDCFYHKWNIISIKSKFVGSLLHHVAEKVFGFFRAVCQLTDLELPVSKICLCQRAANLMVIYFFDFHIIHILTIKNILRYSVRVLPYASLKWTLTTDLLTYIIM